MHKHTAYTLPEIDVDVEAPAPARSGLRPKASSELAPAETPKARALRIAERRFASVVQGWAEVTAALESELVAIDAGERKDVSGLERQAQSLHRYTMLARQVGLALLRERAKTGWAPTLHQQFRQVVAEALK